jgi:cysteine synthase A
MIYDYAYDVILDDVYLNLDGFFPGVRLLLKIEAFNPAGSIKLKAAVALIKDAEARGHLRSGGRVIESSSGNLGIALSSVCAARGYGFTCVVDPNTSPHSIGLMRAFGAEIVVVDKRDSNGGYLQSRIDHIHHRLRLDPDLVWTNQYANTANVRAHYDHTATAIVKQPRPVDVLVIGAGTTGTLMGCGSYFKDHNPQTVVMAVDTIGSVTFGHPAGPRYIPGLGTSRRPEIFGPEPVDDLVLVAEADAVRICRRLARERGIAVGGSTGSILAAIESKAPRLNFGTSVVAISPDLGDRYLSTVYDDMWVAERFELG